MPEKEGSEDEKTTKSVVKKKQKQMMGEEGYDTYRDNILMRGGDHRSKETKEKSYTPSKQPKGQTAAQKAAKGKSALELVKADITKKYGKGAIMDVGKKKVKEELDLTKIAESFGGYLIEIEIKRDKSGTIIDVETTAAEKEINKKAKEKQKEIFRKAEAARKRKVTKVGRATLDGIENLPDDEAAAQAATIAQRDIAMDKSDLGGKIEPETQRAMRSMARGKGGRRKLADTTPAGKVKIIRQANPNVPIKKPTTANVKPGSIPKPKPKPKARVFSYMRKPSPEAQKRVDAVMRGIKARETLNPDKRSRKRVSASGTEFKIPSKPKVPKFKKTPIKLTKPSDVELPQSFKDFSSKLKSLKADIKQSKNKVKEPSRSDTSSSYDTEQLKKRGQYDQYKKIKDSTPKGGIPDWMKQVDKKRKEIQQQPYQKGVKPAFKRVFLTKGKGVRGVVSKIVKNPVGTAIATGIARDSFRSPQLPPLPVVKGGRVGKRTAG